MKKRRFCSRFIDDQAVCDSDSDDLFASSVEDEASPSDLDFIDNNDESDSSEQLEVAPEESYSNPADTALLAPYQRRILKTFLPPGWERYPLTQWSLTVTKVKSDIAVPALDEIFSFVQTFCIKGGLSTEVGRRAHNLHLQGVFSCLFPCTPQAVKVLGPFIKSFLTDKGKGHRVLCKPLTKTQDFTTMCGYILKDEGQTWFQFRCHNIPRAHLEQGRLKHMSQLTSIDEGKVQLTQRNFTAEMYKFLMRVLFPCITPLRYTAMYAMQSGGYIPSPEWIRKYSKINTHEGEALWKVVFSPKNTTIEDTDRIFFDSMHSLRTGERYFISGPLGSSPRIREPSIRTPHNDDRQKGISSIAHITPIHRIQNILQSASKSPRIQPRSLEEDFTPLPEDPAEYSIMEDRRPDPLYQTLHDLTCPDTLDEMIQIVTNIRRKRMDILNEQQHVAARTAELETSRNHDQLTETNSFPSANLALLPASFVST